MFHFSACATEWEFMFSVKKPMAVTEQECRRMIQALEKMGVALYRSYYAAASGLQAEVDQCTISFPVVSKNE